MLKGEARRRRQRDPSYALPGHAHHGAAGVHGATAQRRARASMPPPACRSRPTVAPESENITLAARNALINMIDYIADAYGLSREQAYCRSNERRRRPAHPARSSTCPT